MKKIGFIDYYLSEWHANNYPDFIKKLTDDYEVAYACAEKDVSENPPHVVLKVGIEEIHGPTFLLWWKTAQHQQSCVAGQEGF